MQYVILVNDDDSLYGSQKKRIMQRQKLVNDLIFVVNPIYNNFDIEIILGWLFFECIISFEIKKS